MNEPVIPERTKYAGESITELVAKNICPRCMGELDTGWECNNCEFDAIQYVPKEKP